MPLSNVVLPSAFQQLQPPDASKAKMLAEYRSVFKESISHREPEHELT